MLNEKGQAFDAFKLLIAAVVAGAILMIIMGMLRDFILPVNQPLDVIKEGISEASTSNTFFVVSKSTKFIKGGGFDANAVSDKAGINPGTVLFCNKSVRNSLGGDANIGCPLDYCWFNSSYFTVSGTPGDANNPQIIKVNVNVQGKIRVYNKEGKYYIGFKPEGR